MCTVRCTVRYIRYWVWSIILRRSRGRRMRPAPKRIRQPAMWGEGGQLSPRCLLHRIVYYHNYRHRRAYRWACARGLVITIIIRARARRLGAVPRRFDRSETHVRGAATGIRVRAPNVGYLTPNRYAPPPIPSCAANEVGWRDSRLIIFLRASYSGNFRVRTIIEIRRTKRVKWNGSLDAPVEIIIKVLNVRDDKLNELN